MKKISIAILICLTILGCKDEYNLTPQEKTWFQSCKERLKDKEACLTEVLLNRETKKLTGIEYTLNNAPEDAIITLTFSDTDNRYFGQVVNRYFGTYEFGPDGKLTLSGAASTLMLGPSELMQTEQDYLQNLTKVIGYTASDTGLTLELSDGTSLEFTKTPK